MKHTNLQNTVIRPQDCAHVRWSTLSNSVYVHSSFIKAIRHTKSKVFIHRIFEECHLSEIVSLWSLPQVAHQAKK
jgi:hypothetical protein